MRFLLSICLCISASPAFAVDWSINAGITETTELNDNQFLRSMLAGGTLASYTTITANATARTPTSRFSLDTNFSYTKYLGPGAEGIPLTESTANGVNAHYETFGSDAANRQYIDASWQRSSAALAVLSNLGFVTPLTGDIDNVSVRGGIERDLTALDFATLSARSNLSYYDPSSAGTQFLDTALDGTWRHRVNGLASFNIFSEAEWLSYDNASKTNLLILRNTAGVDLTVTPLLSFHGSAGAAYVQANQQGSVAPIVLVPLSIGNPTAVTPIVIAPSTIGLTSGSGSAIGFIGDMSINYRILKDTTLSFTASQSVGPSVIGSLVQSSSIGASLAYQINQVSTLTLSGSYSLQNSGGTTDFVSGSISYSRQLTKYWSSNLAYRYLHRSAASQGASLFDPVTGLPVLAGIGPASSNSLTFSISRSFVLLPPGT